MVATAPEASVGYSARNTPKGYGLDSLPISLIVPSPLNPRKKFDEAALAELAESIRQHGVLEPLVVRQVGQLYELIAGERRWRASQIAGLETVPARVLEGVDDPIAIKLMLVENLQRRDLDPIEEAEGYRQLNQVVGLRQAEIAAAVNRSQPAVANRMRLLDLPEDVRERIRAGELSPAHGVALARYGAYPKLVRGLADLTVKYHLTSKELEDRRIPRAWDLVSLGALRILDYSCRFDKLECQSCRNRRSGGERDQAVCFDPECYERKNAEAAAAKIAFVEQKLATARDSGRPLLTLNELGHDNYIILRNRKTPAGCHGEACDRRATALDWEQKETLVCADVKCWRKLEAVETRAAKKAKRIALNERRVHLNDVFREADELGPRELAVLVTYALEHVEQTSYNTALRARPSLANLTDERPLPSNARKFAERYAGVPLTDLALAAVQAILQTEVAHELKDNYYGANHHLAAWYLGEKEDEAR